MNGSRFFSIAIGATFALLVEVTAARAQQTCDVDGAPCDDGNLCTIDDTCLGGQCTGEDGCMDRPACHDVACDPSVGSCEVTPHPDGTDCDDANPCTVGDACQSGECEPGDFIIGLGPLLFGRPPHGPPASVAQLLDCILHEVLPIR